VPIAPLCVPVAHAGDSGLRGGVPNLGGDVPSEFDRAAARAETPGPAKVGLEPAPGSGELLPDGSFATWPSVGICCTGDVPKGCVGTGEASRAVDSARESDGAVDRPRCDPGDEDMGTARGRRGDVDGPPRVAISHRDAH
jgi:hypothetical protein